MKALATAILVGLALPSWAQHEGYAGQQGREIKALSAEEVSQYLAGAGMGFAKSAELNHYPGPMHALELADRLGLTGEQREATRKLMETHKAEARALGGKVVAAEQALDALFRKPQIVPSALADAIAAAASAQGAYRLSHLETHRRMRALLIDEQVHRYDRARGYTSSPPAGHSGHKH